MRSGRGAIFLETALVMPIYLVLLCMCIDIPRILMIKQRLDGAQRLVSEIRARNEGTLTVDTAFLQKTFFDDGAGNGVKITIKPYNDKGSIMNSALNTIQDWLKDFLGKFLTGVLEFLVNIISGGSLEPYFLNVFNKDVFYSGEVTANAPTLLPAIAYNAFAGDDLPPSDFGTGYACYMPSCNSCKYTGETFISKMCDWIHRVFG